MDVRMPGMDGISATRQLTGQTPPPTRVLVLTTFDVDSYVYGALRAGASGFLLKNAPPEELIRAIRLIAAGEALLDPAVTLRVIEEFSRIPERPTEPAELTRLTDREREVLLLVARGLSNAEIAVGLFVSEATIKSHMARLLAKLMLRDRAQAIVYAYENGLVVPG
jgi:DNA-binding NarL/FixJ family response regulator